MRTKRQRKRVEVTDEDLKEAAEKLFTGGRRGPGISDEELLEAERLLFEGGRRLGDVAGSRR